jgi:hypothetical protein
MYTTQSQTQLLIKYAELGVNSPGTDASNYRGKWAFNPATTVTAAVTASAAAAATVTTTTTASAIIIIISARIKI